ncbi:MAG: 50S ribosomal protein L4 [Bacteroidia bacterium]|nr:50S ribosomal protein L4 [Bacteroidia bacterium]
MEIAVKNTSGKDTGKKVSLNDSVFGLENPSNSLIYQDVRLILANRRQGTVKTKARGEVHGTNKKPFKQKGTGGARGGDRKSPLWRHGGTVFGPQPRNYSFKLNKKARNIARASALTHKAVDGKITVLENFTMDAPKTKQFISILDSLALSGVKVLLVLPGDNANIYLSGRNVPKAKVIRAADLNTVDILHADSLVILEDAVSVIEQNILAN